MSEAEDHDESAVRSVELSKRAELAPAAYAVQNAVRMPVYDFSTLIRFAHDASRARQYHGFM